MCSGVVNMKIVREFNIAQEIIVSTVMYMYVVFVISLYYPIKIFFDIYSAGILFYHSHVSTPVTHAGFSRIVYFL